MASPLISQYLPPDIDPTKASIAYGRRALPKLNEELQSPDLLTRQRALMALCDLVHDPEHAYQAIGIGFLDTLKCLLKDPDSTVRQKTIEVFNTMANHSVGREGFLKHGVILALSQILDDPVLLCRRFLHQTFKNVAQVPTVLLLYSSWDPRLRSNAPLPSGRPFLSRLLLQGQWLSALWLFCQKLSEKSLWMQIGIFLWRGSPRDSCGLQGASLPPAVGFSHSASAFPPRPPLSSLRAQGFDGVLCLPAPKQRVRSHSRGPWTLGLWLPFCPPDTRRHLQGFEGSAFGTSRKGYQAKPGEGRELAACGLPGQEVPLPRLAAGAELFLGTGADAIIQKGLIPSLVNKVKDEDEEIQELILDTLYFCLRWDASPALQSKAVPILREKLSDPNENIRSKAAHALMAICMPREGKNQVWDYGVIPLLVLLLDDFSIDVKANAAGALMFAAVTTADLVLYPLDHPPAHYHLLLLLANMLPWMQGRSQPCWNCWRSMWSRCA
uniref:Radial spoke head 14 homolog isoform X2 n=1 Tax=Phascolarctos cinereus TaxID=38626 RepID=A0A6P5L9K0_PHACI|nr:radial spoke head 14 homolog isoform X2 [Phascolarctos cinereus]